MIYSDLHYVHAMGSDSKSGVVVYDLHFVHELGSNYTSPAEVICLMSENKSLAGVKEPEPV